jgi:hypothetical protein
MNNEGGIHRKQSEEINVEMYSKEKIYIGKLKC